MLSGCHGLLGMGIFNGISEDSTKQGNFPTRTIPVLSKPLSCSTSTKNPNQNQSQAGKHTQAEPSTIWRTERSPQGRWQHAFFQPRSILTTPDCRTQSRSSPKSRSPFWGGGANPRSHPRRQRNRGITSYNAVRPQTGFMRFAWKATRLT